MIYTLLEIYLSGVCLFLAISLLRIETCHLDTKLSRSRETKALLRQKIRRCKRDIKMSFVWPALLYRLLKSYFEEIKKSE